MKINRHILENGLRLVHSQDESTQMVALNILYNVGARDEDPEHTGFAHLFEHLMFGGSVNIPDYDMPLQLAGGENNAWTNNDITNYYLTVPRQNVETGFWLESDRMLSLDFSERSLEVQRGVVMEEFKQRCLNQPYGDVGHLLRPLAYQTHPYQWPTIGKELSHIANATLEEVKAFFFRFYAPIGCDRQYLFRRGCCFDGKMVRFYSSSGSSFAEPATRTGTDRRTVVDGREKCASRCFVYGLSHARPSASGLLCI